MRNERIINPNAQQLSDYNTLHPFRFWCQKVLPLVYDDSLSYYELLCKIVTKINEIIKSNNELEKEINIFLNKFDTNLFTIVDKIINELIENGELNLFADKVNMVYKNAKSIGALSNTDISDILINYISAGNKSLYLPYGNYTISKTVDLTGFTLIGDTYDVNISVTTKENAVIMGNNSVLKNINFKLNVINTVKNNNPFISIRGNEITNIVIDNINLSLDYFTTAIEIEMNNNYFYFNKIKNIHCEPCYDFITIVNKNNSGWGTDNYFENLSCRGFSHCGLILSTYPISNPYASTQFTHNVFTNISLEDTYDNGLEKTGMVIGIGSNYFSGIKIFNDTNTGTLIAINFVPHPVSSPTFDSFNTFIGCNLEGLIKGNFASQNIVGAIHYKRKNASETTFQTPIASPKYHDYYENLISNVVLGSYTNDNLVGKQTGIIPYITIKGSLQFNALSSSLQNAIRNKTITKLSVLMIFDGVDIGAYEYNFTPSSISNATEYKSLLNSFGKNMVISTIDLSKAIIGETEIAPVIGTNASSPLNVYYLAMFIDDMHNPINFDTFNQNLIYNSIK